MISLRKITLENRASVFILKVAENQRHFVASNLSSLASAYVLTTNGGNAFPFAIYADEQMVGFVMLGYGTIGYSCEPQIAYENYCLWRFMIDEQYQNQGYGKEAMIRILEFVRTFPKGPAEYCWLSYEPDNIVAKKLYERFGFHETGEMCGDEIVAVLKL